ncbi:uncharacterized protein J8A68_001387 [[Candida] subhashii]|uniref:CTLH domain-containing protein n=1 Tax=[Candida] subhashii TaxID=561895 RepID=A0A8J5QRG6_9ASCO|nr:uncharacterized protein J8A68_001387 [[Candida] subhashii]KAG7665078.1 hypothetical protein J8A68_001387 [[Candida] subhashii]
MTSIPQEKIDHLILNYFIQEGYQQAAISFAQELNIDINNRSVSPQKTQQQQQQQHLLNHQHHPFINQLNNLSKLNEDEFSSVVMDYFKSDNLENSRGTIVAPVPVGSGTGSTGSDNVGTKLISGYSTIIQRQEIKMLILKGQVTEAIKKISEYFPTILDLNNLLHFKLLRLNLIEMIRNHKLTTSTIQTEDERKFLDDILSFVRENLINKVSNSFKLLKELEITMSLLCFNFDPNIKNIQDQKDLPEELRSLFNLSLRNQCYRLVNRAILNLYDNENINNNSSSTSGGNKLLAADDDDNDNRFIDEIMGVSHEDQRKKDIMQIYKGPKFVEFDLSNLEHSPVGSSGTARGDEEDDEDEDEDDMDMSTIEYNINSHNAAINQILNPNDTNQNQNNNDKDGIEDEISKLQTLSLESKLERVVKLWTITEQRLLDLNIIKEKRYILNEE